ncbi:MAG: hypothetical protein PF484_08550 [Bacteroidales bacterium]|jgi:hypothetical protein|nr:hypothetical protein [Bacteroidales bacterium]
MKNKLSLLFYTADRLSLHFYCVSIRPTTPAISWERVVNFAATGLRVYLQDSLGLLRAPS